MVELNFKLEIFEGPLDLLLSLIQKHKLNIQDIEISVLLDQFLIYLERMTEADIEVTSEFLEMAARLILIKSAALLPKEEAEKMKIELQGALIEYALCKTMAEKLKNRWCGSDVFVRKPMEIEVDSAYRRTHQPEEITYAYGAVSERARRKEEAPRSVAPIVAKPFVTVFTGIVKVLKALRLNKTVRLSEIYEGHTRSQRVSIFLAILELSKSGRVFISEDGDSISLIVNKDAGVNNTQPGDAVADSLA
ncbi:MAG: segregation/condensation protein A [Oscillospiraceae bacterium]|nr:segregation/condensation protein A [Oscillospiraceae bacterium]